MSPMPNAATPMGGPPMGGPPMGGPMGGPPMGGPMGGGGFGATRDEDDAFGGEAPDEMLGELAADAPYFPHQVPEPMLEQERSIEKIQKEEAKKDAGAPLARRQAVGGSPYLVKLAMFAHELEQQARGACDATALRLLRQRLVEWCEDLRSVGSNDALADAVDRLVLRLTAALAAAALAAELLAIAGELSALAAGAPPPPAPKKSRAAFWK
jgi:hypothetical protein